MFKNKIAISKNFIIAICFISLLLFAITNVSAIDVNESDNCVLNTINEDHTGVDAIDEDKLGNSQNDMLSSKITLNGGNFSNIKYYITYIMNDGDELDLRGNFVSDGSNSHIVVHKNITISSSTSATLNAKNLSAIFVVEPSGSGSTFSNLNLKNGNANYGGAMLIYGHDVTVTNCTFDNNYASKGGGAIYTDYNINQTSSNGRNLLIENCKFNNNFAVITAGAVGAYGVNTRILNCEFNSNSVYDKSGGSVYGGAIQVGKNEFSTNTLIKNCNFINNKAISTKKTGLSHGGACCLRDGVTYENCYFEGNSADFGGALVAHHSGTIKNCNFKSNTANDYGGAIANMDDVTSMNLNIIDCTFESNSAPYGGAAKLAGYSITIDDCDFNKNYASIDGGALYIDTKTLDVYDSNFNQNSAEHNGGAVYVNGEATTVQGSTFKSNVAIANSKVKDDGLGGAIYINGSSDSVINNVFQYNVARNGSAIYYDKSGKDLKITNNEMTKNQAWVYALPIYAEDIYYGEEEKVGAVIYGGNNIADYDNLAVSNAIYNAASYKYIKVNGENPVLGATNSGSLYQDSREYNMDVLLTVKHSDGTVAYNKTLKSSYLGEVSSVLTNLKPGTYTVTATHYEDNYYKAITNTTTFKVIPLVDIEVKKTVSASSFNYQDSVVWTITVVNNGPNDGTGVNVTDTLPAGLVYKSATASTGSYSNGVWTIGSLANGKSATLKITTLINKTGDITNTAKAVVSQTDTNTSNNQASKKITVAKATDLAITKKANVTKTNYDGLVKWTLTVTNNGPDSATNVVVNDTLPNGLVLKNSPSGYSNGKWSVGTLNVGQSKSLEIITSLSKTGSITNTASVSGDQYDYNSANNQASATITVESSIDLSITKKVNNSAPSYGDLVKWTLTVKNNGPDAASGVKVSDVLPSALVYQSCSASVGSYSGGVWSVGSLAKGASATLSIVTKVSATGSIKNSAGVSGNEDDSNPSNNNAESSINVAKATDLEITKEVNNTTPNYGDLVKWTIAVKNNGPDAASGVKVIDTLPAGITYQSSTMSKGTYSNGVWNVGSLANGASATLNLICKVEKTGAFTNKVSVSGNEHDYNPENNNAESSISVAKSADLSITKKVNNSAPNYDSMVKWTLTVKNNGPDAASGVKVSDVLPEGLIYCSSTGNYSNGVWNIGSLAKGASATLNIITKIAKTGSIKNTANVSGNEYDFDKTNNNAESQITVVKASDLSVTKSVNNTTPNYKDLVKWTITVKNNGPDIDQNIVLTDDMPEDLIINSTTGNYINGKWAIGSLKVGESKSFEIITQINKTGSFTNFVSVVGMEYDYDLSNNNASKTINVPKAADLSINKTVNNTAPNYGDLVKWTLTVKNNGIDNASGVKVKDILDDGLIYCSSTGNYSNGIWTIGNLAKNTTVSINITCKVNKTGLIRNIASVSGNEYDINKTNNNDNASINVPKASDLSVVKSVNDTAPNYGDLVKWTLTVFNDGPDTASDVVVSDVLPEGLIYCSSTGNYSNGVWNIGELASKTSISLDIICMVNKTGLIVNNINVTGKEYDINKTNNNASKNITVPKASDLSLVKSVNDTAPNYGDLVKWTLTVFNDGPDTASDVVVSDVLPEGLVYCSSTGNYSNDTWFIGNLSKNTSISLDIICMVNKTGQILNYANVTANEYDINKTNNNASKNITVPKAADLEINKYVNDTNPVYLKLIQWTVTVKNNGPDNATNVNVTEILPEALVLISSNTTAGYYSNGTWFIGNLTKDESVTLNIISMVNKTGLINNIVNVTGNEYDINKTNNIANQSINVDPACDLEIIKIVNNTNPYYNDLVKWVITVKNNGPDNAHDIIVDDNLPEGLVIKNTNGNYSDGKWYIDNLNAFSSKTLEIITLINKTGISINNASVLGREYDYNKSNNHDNASITVPPSADLEILKIASNQNPNYTDTVKWTIVVKNNGPDRATNVYVNEVLSQAFELISSYANKGAYVNDVWSIGNLDAGEIVSLEIITKINKTGNFTNHVSVHGNEHDYNKSNNEANESIIVNPAADLSVTKKANVTNLNYNDLVKWTINIVNNGPDKANNIEIFDDLPEGLEFISYNATKGFYSEGYWKFCCLEVGESQSLELITKVKNIGEIKNIIEANAKEYDFNLENNKDEFIINVNPASDLQITKLVNQSKVNYKDLMEWTLIVKNNGPSDATNVLVIDSMPEGLIFVSAQGDGIYQKTGTWYVGNLASGQTKELKIISLANKTGEFKNIVFVQADQYDYDESNNKAEKSVIVPSAADLSIIKTVSNSTYHVGDIVTYTIEITNNGPDTARNITVNEIMDESLELKSYSLTSGEYDRTNNVWFINSLANGDKCSLIINVLATKEGMINNSVYVSCDSFDYNSDNNFAQCIVEIIKKIIDPENPLNPGLYAQYGGIHSPSDKNANAAIEMKESGLPVGLLILVALISLAFSKINISKKR